ncbi:MAG: hypothetical protein U5K74_14715 [Gemmatimonadaceae bacterium]|nr:hypothetical protein [Gemmatimonadaceae bacterium]
MTVETVSQTHAPRKPLDSELDVHGLTHVGLVRSTNQDHFLISSLRREVVVHQTSLPATDAKSSSDRMAFLAVVADGVGSSLMGGEASRQAVEGILNYVSACSKCFYEQDDAESADLNEALSPLRP